jgi:FrmR/RcnR family transcriptional regulator, repressor of frmRAB operon
VWLAPKVDTMARYPSGKGGASKPLCVGSSPARATSTFVFQGICVPNASNIDRDNRQRGLPLSHTTKDLKKQLSRIRRIKGQVEAIERALQGDGDSEDILQLVASCRGALNGLMAGLIEGHLRYHVLPPANKLETAQVEAANELVAVVKRYFN